MIILSKRVGQVSSNQPLGHENYGPQDSRLILLNGVILRNSTFIFSCGLHVNIFYVKYLIQVITK